MRLGIDLDGVVANFNAGWMRRYNDEYGTDLKPESAACSVTCLSIQMHSKVSPD